MPFCTKMAFGPAHTSPAAPHVSRFTTWMEVQENRDEGFQLLPAVHPQATAKVAGAVFLKYIITSLWRKIAVPGHHLPLVRLSRFQNRDGFPLFRLNLYPWLCQYLWSLILAQIGRG